VQVFFKGIEMKIFETGLEAQITATPEIGHGTIHIVKDKSESLDLFYEIFFVETLLATLGIQNYVIAGGYVRDKLHGVPFKDIDIFLPGNEPADEAAASDIDYGDVDYRIASSHNLTYRDLLLNFVRLRSNLKTEQVLSRMDIGLCQVGLDEQRRVVATQAYLNDSANRTLTVLRQSHSDHVQRVRAKYPDYKVISEPQTQMDLH
jgi:hypothetical protein